MTLTMLSFPKTMVTMAAKIDQESKRIRVGDILEDTVGNKMVVIDVLADSTNECYVLLNGRIRLVNAQGSSIIKSHKTASAPR